MTTASDVSKKENPSLLDDTAEELKAGSNAYTLESTANDDSTPVQKEPGTKTQVAVEGQRSGADISEGPDKKEEIGTEVDEKDWDDDIKPVRPEQQPRGRVKPPVSGPSKPKPK
ncbi:hypothetical protein HHX47_DHR2001016 [Lentinula edodes]|nr:hypothetical protein HHX47_DHR2001016 [Lentinula edodes]